ncbi:phospholipase A2 large subunit [Drosophila novamexicana]|uniref:phospholipase A2 large subunit n=1 Tax=Drosophila novamexicana TaxID=47314 RepID=UPI0011E5B2C5|nr:phospholipase A2 large subunit [Drosophila novamexicana]
MRAKYFVIALAAMLASVHGLGITVPGTKWCGPGNTADNYNDLGSEVELDMCCRQHDHCEEKISPDTQKYGLTNDGFFPIFSCDCELAFRLCLNSLHNMESAALGRIYFSTTNVCFAYGPPIVSCQEQQWDHFMKRCLTYSEDVSQPGRWQFYDLAFYTHPSEEEK